MRTRYHCEAYNEDGKRIGGFVVLGGNMTEALFKASSNIEVRLRPDQHELRVSKLPPEKP